MNILFLTTHLNMGGITKYLQILSEGMIARGHTVHIISSGGDMEETFAQMGVRHKKLNIKTKSELSLKVHSALGPLKEYIAEHNIDILHPQTRITQVMSHRVQKKVRKPIVATCHGYFKTRLSRRMFPCWGDKVIAISDAVQNHLLNDFKVPPTRVYKINNGIDLNEFVFLEEAERIEARKRFNFGTEPIIGMIARLSEVKGQDVLIWAMSSIIKEFPDIKLLLVGQGKTEKELKELVGKLNLTKNILFYPVVNKTMDYLSVMDVFVMPSRQEGLGLSVLEAQAAGVPVVASNVGGLPNIIEDEETGFLVDPENSDALAFAITNLLKDSNKQQSMVKKARALVEQNFSAEHMVEQTLSLYSQFGLR